EERHALSEALAVLRRGEGRHRHPGGRPRLLPGAQPGLHLIESAMTTPNYPLRPFLPGDTMALRELFAQSIEELAAEDYDEDQRVAWAAAAADAEAFAERLGGMVTLVVQIGGEYAGFASLKDNKTFDMLFVHPYHA